MAMIHADHSEASREYSVAYAAQYSAQNLPLALRLYRKLLASHARDKEAEYSRMQIQNIVNAVVPKQELLDAQCELAIGHFEKDKPQTAEA
jgi:hypothetical protein